MKWLTVLLFMSGSAVAQTSSGLRSYLEARKIKCTLTDKQFEDQILGQIELFKQKIAEDLIMRGSDVQQVGNETPDFLPPQDPAYDFEVSTNIKVVIQRIEFHLRTTIPRRTGVSERMGLWFPLTISDPGSSKPCQLSRVSLKPEQRASLPTVDLVMNNPPSVVAARVVEVMDIKEDAAKGKGVATPSPERQVEPAQAPPPQAEKIAEPRQKHNPEPAERESRRATREHERARERAQARAEERAERRERRRERRERRRQQRSERAKESEQKSAPPAADECAGDVSVWKSLACKIQGK